MKHEEIFEQHDPPRGGLAKLRERLDARPTPVWKRALLVAPAAVAIAAIVFLVLSRVQPPDLVASARGNGGLDQVALGLAPPPAAPVALAGDNRANAGITEVRSSNPNVVFAWVVTKE